MGSFVVGLGQRDPFSKDDVTPQIVYNGLQAIEDYADGALADARAYSEEWLRNYIGVEFPEITVLYQRVTGTLTDALTLLQQYRPDRPSDSDLYIPTPENVAVPDFDPIPDFNFRLEEIDIPTVAFTYAYSVYVSALYDQLIAKIQNDLVNGMDSTTEEAMFERARERLRVKYEADRQKMLEMNLGFDLPTGAILGALAELTAEENRALTDLNRDIIVKQFEYKQFLLQQGIAYDTSLRDAHEKAEATQMEAAKQEALVPLELSKVRAQVFAEKTKANLDYVRLIWEKIKLSSDQKMVIFNASIERAKYILNAWISHVEAIIKRYGVDIEAYKADMAAIEIQIKGEMSWFENAVKQEIGKVNAEVQDKKVVYDAFIAKLNAAAEALKGKFNVASQIAAAAINALHFSAQIGSQVSTGESANWSYGEQIGNTLSEQYQLSPS